VEILVCVKRVPTVGGTITLTGDGLSVDTRMSGFTISPHEECAVEEAVRLCERFGGSVTVVSLGPAQAEEQLRACLALGASSALLLETSGEEFGPVATAAALHLVAAAGRFDLILLGNEASDTGDYQVGIRLAHLLGWPVATGIKALTMAASASSAEARREYRGVAETYTLPLPSVVTVKEASTCRATRRCPAGCARSGRRSPGCRFRSFPMTACGRPRCGCPPSRVARPSC
jgi:electron transfer flavoprotein beta subunit